MLRRCAVPTVRAALATTTSIRRYRYAEFEMSKLGDEPMLVPREAPNTSYFNQFQANFYQHWGWGREEVWLEGQGRRYETTWQILRKWIMCCVPLFFVFPLTSIGYFANESVSEYGEKPWLCPYTHLPWDNMYIQCGFSSLDPEYIRHIHSKESF